MKPTWDGETIPLFIVSHPARAARKEFVEILEAASGIGHSRTAPTDCPHDHRHPRLERALIRRILPVPSPLTSEAIGAGGQFEI